MKKVELYILILILVICGIYVSKVTMDYTLTTRNLVWVIGTFVLFLLVALRAISDPSQVDLSILSRMIFPVICGFFVVALFSLTQAANLSEGIYEVLSIFTGIVFLFVATVIIMENNQNILIKFIILLALGLGTYGLYQYFTMTESPALRFGTMANMNLCSSSHLLLMPFSIYAVFKYSKFWKVIGGIAVLVALFIILFSLRTRSTWVALFFAAMVATLHKRKLVAITLVSFVLLGVVLYTVKGEKIFGTASMKQRGDLWSQSLNMVKDNPLGVGAGNWRVAIPFYSRNFSKTTRDIAFITIYFQRPHNGWLGVLTEIGVFGFLLYATFFGLGLYYAIKARSVLVYSSLVAYMIIAVFSFPKERVFHSMIVLIFIAISISLYHKPKPIKLNRGVIYLASVFVLAGLSFAIVNFSARYLTERNVFRVFHAKAADDWESVSILTEDISKFSTLDSFSTPLVFYQGVSNLVHKDFNRALRNFQAAKKQNPNHIHNLMSLASCLVVTKRLPEAREYYEKILELYPGYERAERNLEVVNKVIEKNTIAMKGTK